MMYWNSIGDAVESVERVFAGTPGWRGGLLRITGVLVPFLVYGAVLHTLWPSAELLSAAIAMDYSFAVAAGLVLWIAYGWPGWLGRMASLTLTLVLFSLPLLALWTHVRTHSSAIGGLLPVSDASLYYYDAGRLLEGHRLGWSSRRPLFVGTLATLLGLAGQNLQVTLAMFVAVNAVACFLLAQEIRASQGTLTAVILVTLLFHFYRLEGGPGTTLTENLGLPLGMSSFAMLWRGARERRVGIICLGLGLLTIALMVRPGAFFVLPALMFGGAWSFRGQGRYSGRFLAGAATAIFLSLGLSLGLGKLLADPANQQTPFPNFSYTLYGVVVGGKGWAQVLSDHPGAREGAEVYAAAWQAFRARPMGIVLGSLAMWRQYLPFRPFHAFAFVRFAAYAEAVQAACYALTALGVVLCIRRYNQPHRFLLIAAAIGHLASIPFAPPLDAGLRVYAATVPILAILVALAGGELAEGVRRMIGLTRLGSPTTTLDTVGGQGRVWATASVGFGLGMAALVIVGPLVTRVVGGRPRFDEVPCPAGEQAVYVRVSAGSFLRIVDDAQGVDDRRVSVPEIRVTALQQAAGIVGIGDGVVGLTAGQTLMFTHDVKSGRPFWLIAPTDLLRPASSLVRVCGNHGAGPPFGGYGLFYANSMARVGLP